jgi:membrane protein implicated in regulation of membrane protease activity
MSAAALIVSPWAWLVLAALLGAAEIAAPGLFLIWLAGAALATALAVALGVAGWWPLVAFALLSVAAVLVGKRIIARHPPVGDAPGLNRAGERLLGQVVTVEADFIGGRGRVRVGDGGWPARGPDLAAGAQARVVAVDGGTLVVEAA